MKTRFLFAAALVLCPFVLKAQKAEEALIAAELNFAGSCAGKGIKSSFLMHVDSSAVAFADGQVVNARQQLWADPDLPGLISWAPSYAEMSVTGNWGYTTGNYEVRPDRVTDSVVSAGRYTTVWHKTTSGEWKYLIDLGVRYAQRPLEKKPVVMTAEKIKERLPSSGTFLRIERDYIRQLQQDPARVYSVFYSQQYVLNLNGYPLINSLQRAAALMQEPNRTIQYEPKGVMVSPAHDMAAVYGIVTWKDKRNGYLRIWRHEKSGWKIALEVLPI